MNQRTIIVFFVWVMSLSMNALAMGLSGEAQETKKLVQELYGEFALECEYEVTSILDTRYGAQKPKRQDGVILTSFGKVRFSTDQLFKIETLTKDMNRELEVETRVSSDGRLAYRYTKEQGRLTGEAFVGGVSKQDLELNGTTLFEVFRLPRLVEELESPLAEVTWQGNETIEGCNCRILSIRHYKNQPIDKGSKTVYWIDFSKNGLVLRRDFYFGTKLVRKLVVNRFQKFPLGAKNVWLPLDAVDYGYLTSDGGLKAVYMETPVGRAVYHVMEQSVQMFPKMDSTKFSLSFPNGTSVTDHYLKKKYEVGQDRRPRAKSDAETRQRLNEYLSVADNQAHEIKAPSLERGGVVPSTSRIASWVLITIGSLALVTLILRSIKKKS
jgi:hypothetical protein